MSTSMPENIRTKQVIRQLLQRRKQWERLYSPEYVKRFFILYDGELEALLRTCRESLQKPNLR